MYLTQAIKRAVQVNAGGLATLDSGRERTWAECGRRVAKLAGALRELGIRDGQRAAVLARNSDRYFEFFQAVAWSGGVFVPINTRLAPPEIAYWLNDSGSEVLFVDDAFLAAVKSLAGQLPALRHSVYIGDGPTPEGLLSYEDILDAASEVADAERCYDDVAGLFYTGGTTGQSKGVMLSHRNLFCNNLHVIPIMQFDRDMRWLHAGPMFHIADGLSVFGVTMVAGGHIFVPGFEPKAVLEAIQSHKITNTLLVPTMINMLVHHPDVADYDLSTLRAVTYGASPMPEAVILKALEVLPQVDFTHAYGQTECAPLVTANGPEFHVLEGPNAGRYKSAGRPVLGVELKVIDEAGGEVQAGVVGEVCVRGPNVMLGYWQQPEQTAEVLREGWMHSGDGGYIDEQGFLYIVDRVKDMIISGGENIYSAEVENAIQSHAAVADCAVVGVPDEKWGERVQAIVRLHDGQTAGEEDIISHCHTLIAGFKCPRGVTFRDEPLPLSGAGKILKTELRKPFWEGHEKQVH